jgi:diguanylate cyclase (GGDEF)-like protein
MLRSTELPHVWAGLFHAWKAVEQAPRELERWAAFMPHCDQLWTLVQAPGQHDPGIQALAQALAPLLELLAEIAEPTDTDRAMVEGMMPAVAAAVRTINESERRRLATGHAWRRETPPLVVMLSTDEHAVHDVLLRMEHYGYVVQMHADYRLGLAQAIKQQAVAVVVDLENGFDATTSEVVDELNQQGIRWCAMARRGDYALRLQSVRQGALFFFVPPLSIDALVEVLDPVAYPLRQEPFRVLILDDSRTVIAGVRQALTPFTQIQLGTLTKPDKILDVLHYFAPDVLLLDVHLKDCTGIEVAQIIRQHKAFESIPIVYLTSETSEATHVEAMRHGGDDFLIKPVRQAQLVNTIINKAQRYRGLRKMMVEDGLTGLYNHVKSKSLLRKCLQRAQRHHVPVSYAILDIDHFKKVNDTYGHAVGDKVIKTLARHLKQRLREADVIGRYGGEEFVVVLYDCAHAKALELFERVRTGFEQIYHTYDDGIFSATFSAGLAHFPDYPSATELMIAADGALYAAKRAGRNCIRQAEATGP